MFGNIQSKLFTLGLAIVHVWVCLIALLATLILYQVVHLIVAYKNVHVYYIAEYVRVHIVSCILCTRALPLSVFS